MEHLTREMIMHEAPGARLDHWVAENIMTVPRLYAYTHCTGEAESYFWNSIEEEEAIRDHAFSIHLPHYSTDIGEAWKVVEELNSRGLSFGIKLDRMGRVQAGSGFEGDEALELVFDDQEYLCTAAEAICKAALLLMLDSMKKSG